MFLESIPHYENTVFPILYSDQHSQKYFTIPMSENSSETYNIYINEVEPDSSLGLNIGLNKFVWDYFSTNELYITIPNDFKLASAKGIFVPLLYQAFLSGELSNYPSFCGIEKYGCATSVASPSLPDQLNAWSFDVSSFFNLEKSIQNIISKTPDPVCKYFTVKNNKLDILSKEYIYANRLDNISVCSAPLLFEPGQLCSCLNFHLNVRQSICVAYEYDYTVIKSTNIVPNNSTDSYLINLVYSQSYDSSHIFKIINDLNCTEISSYSYPSDISYDDLLPQAIDIYNEYIDCYQDHTLDENNNIQEPIAKNKLSYIETLIGT